MTELQELDSSSGVPARLEPTPVRRRRPALLMLRGLTRNPLTFAGMVGILVLVVIGLTARYWVPYPEHILTAPNMRDRLQPPSPIHFFGTDDLGRDIFSRVMVATGLSLRVGVVVVLAAAVVGSAIGAVAGYAGGLVDIILMRVTDGFLAFPPLVLALAIAAALGPGLMNALFAIIIVWWPWYARLVRSNALRVRNDVFVEAARATGCGRTRILVRHVVPNCFVPVLVQASMDFGYVVLTAASLSFIGVGAQPPAPEWGLMVNTGRRFFPDWWWMVTFPGMAIFLAVLTFNLFGDGLREVLDPRMREYR